MTKLVWGTVGQKTYEAGTDRGVLYIDSNGVPWNGLKGVVENPTGGDAIPFYLDGIKYMNVSSAEEFEATIAAFSAPPEFAPCDGSKSIFAGLFITQQPRKQFGLSYRTKVGNDVDGLDLGYKIHLVYNALAGSASRSNTSLSASTDPLDLSWQITTTPPVIAGYRPTSHLVIDSRTTSPTVLVALENVLYGSDTSSSRLPTILEVMSIFANSGSSGMQTVDNGDGSFQANGASVTMVDADSFNINDSAVVDNGDGTFTTV